MKSNDLKWFVGFLGISLMVVMSLAISRLIRPAMYSLAVLFLVYAIWGIWISNRAEEKEQDDDVRVLRYRTKDKVLRKIKSRFAESRKQFQQLGETINQLEIDTAKFIRKVLDKKLIARLSDRELVNAYPRLRTQTEGINPVVVADLDRIVETNTSRRHILQSQADFWETLSGKYRLAFDDYREHLEGIQLAQQELETQKKQLARDLKLSVEMKDYLRKQSRDFSDYLQDDIYQQEAFKDFSDDLKQKISTLQRQLKNVQADLTQIESFSANYAELSKKIDDESGSDYDFWLQQVSQIHNDLKKVRP